MGKEKCWKCKKIKSDVTIHACEERLCRLCAQYNDTCLHYKVFPQWDKVISGQYPPFPGDHISTVIESTVIESTEIPPANEYAENLRVELPDESDDQHHELDGDRSDLNNITIQDPLLAYITFAFHSGTRENIRRAVLGHFSPNVIHNSKDKLWTHCGTSIFGLNTARRGSPTKPKQDFELDDILDSLATMDGLGINPNIVLSADDLHMIPRSHPEELCDISVVDRLNRMEKQIDYLPNTLDFAIAQNINLKDRVHALEQPTYAQAVRHSPATNDAPIPLPQRVVKANIEVCRANMPVPSIVASIGEPSVRGDPCGIMTGARPRDNKPREKQEHSMSRDQQVEAPWHRQRCVTYREVKVWYPWIGLVHQRVMSSRLINAGDRRSATEASRVIYQIIMELSKVRQNQRETFSYTLLIKLQLLTAYPFI